ncbi:thioredoxin family protein [Candidatus Pacearchaeota archaeon]|nr:thioredoxin family protein [Candidatus Pacearchaeota archaeon]
MPNIIELYFFQNKYNQSESKEAKFISRIKEIFPEIQVKEIDIVKAATPEFSEIALDLIKNQGIISLPIVIINDKLISKGKLPDIQEIIEELRSKQDISEKIRDMFNKFQDF